MENLIYVICTSIGFIISFLIFNRGVKSRLGRSDDKYQSLRDTESGLRQSIEGSQQAVGDSSRAASELTGSLTDLEQTLEQCSSTLGDSLQLSGTIHDTIARIKEITNKINNSQP